jgi:hypothetical protein
MKYIFLLSTIILLDGFLVLSQNSFKPHNSSDSVSNISIIGVGDIMLGTCYPDDRFLPPNDNCWPLLQPVADILSSSNITFGNLEGSFSDNAPLTKVCKDSTKCYVFRVPERYAGFLKEAGFDLLSVANNHSGDFGNQARQTTVKILDSLDIKFAGWTDFPTSVFSKDGITYGFCAFAPNNGTIQLTDIDGACTLVAKLDSICDIVIVSFHGGAEGKDFQHVTKQTEIFYGENRGNVYEFAHAIIDAGADVVFGSGPHVSRAFELYHDRFIAYSLGNFCTYRGINLKGVNGLAPIVKLNLLKDGRFINGKLYPTRQIYPGGVSLDSKPYIFQVISYAGEVVKVIKELTENDFQETKIMIKPDGTIEKKP